MSTIIDLPEHVVLRVKPNCSLSQYYPVTLGKKYKVIGQMGCLYVIETDTPGKTASIHWSRFEAISGKD